jgi:tRNA-dihydrouridine synthase 1
VYEVEPPQRRPLFVPGDDTAWLTEGESSDDSEEPAKKKRKKEDDKKLDTSPNLSALQPHLFHVLRHFVTKHTDIRDMLAKARRDGIDGYERVLAAVEKRVAEGLIEYEQTDGKSFEEELEKINERAIQGVPEEESSLGTIKRCKRPWWVAQPIIRPLPSEALAKGAITLKKEKEKGKEKNDGKAKSGNVQVEDKKEVEVEQQTKQEIASRDELVSG